MKLTDELRTQLIEAAAWGKVDVELRLDEKTEVAEEKPSKAKKPSGNKAYKTSKNQDGDEGTEGLKCEEVHACPLCASQLDEAIEEERLLEHLNVVMGLVERLSQLDESEEDLDTVIDDALSDLLLQNVDEEE